MAQDEEIRRPSPADGLATVPARIDRALARQLVVSLAPEYLEMFKELQRPEGWRKIAQVFSDTRKRLKLDNYVVLYEDERRLQASLALALWDLEGLKEMNKELADASDSERQEIIDEWAREMLESDVLDNLFPETERQEEELSKQIEALSGVEKQEGIRRAQYFWSFGIGFFYNMLSVMVHGERLTSLVVKGLRGDKEAFGKAIHIDKYLLHGHAGFREQFEKAQEEPGSAFLADISRRLQAAPTKGRIRYPGVYCVFAMLETLNWFDEFLNEEILDICDEAGLDRWQNRIEDVNYLTKRRLSYRRMQRLGGLSMH